MADITDKVNSPDMDVCAPLNVLSKKRASVNWHNTSPRKKSKKEDDKENITKNKKKKKKKKASSSGISKTSVLGDDFSFDNLFDDILGKL